MEYLEKNLKALENLRPETAKQLRQAAREQSEGLEAGELGDFRIEESRSGVPTVCYTDEDGEERYVHSLYDPEKEAKQILREHLEGPDADRNTLVAAGFGLGYLAEAALDAHPDYAHLYFYEPHAELFMLALAYRDLADVLDRRRTDFTVGPDYTPLLRNMVQQVGDLAGFKGVVYLPLPSLQNMKFGSYIESFGEQVQVAFFQNAGNLQTLMVMASSYLYHSLVSFEEIITRPPVKSLFGEFKDVPGIIVSAGPSLEKNVDLLKERGLEDKALIVAVDTALKPLLDRGIEPHLVCTGDPQEANYRHLKGAETERASLVAEPQAPPKSLAEWRGEEIFICSYGDQFMQWVAEVICERGRVETWGSVATMAFDLMLQLGCDPIVFIGQDLSYPGGKTYVGGTYFETEEEMENTVEELRESDRSLFEVEDIHGETVLTNRQMLSYLEYFRGKFDDLAGRTVINATEGGALTHRQIRQKTLAEVCDEHCTGSTDLFGRIREMSRKADEPNLRHLKLQLDRILSELREGLRETEKGVVEAARVKAIAADDGEQFETLKEYYQKLEKLYNSFQKKDEMKRFLRLANHAALFTFKRAMSDLRRDQDEIDRYFLERAAEIHHTLFSSSNSALERMLPLFEDARDVVKANMGSKEASYAGSTAPEQ